MRSIAEFHNTQSGPVALLGNGRSLASWDLEALAGEMPLFGINRSWKLIETRWTCFVDAEHDDDLRLGRAPWPDFVFSITEPLGLRPSKRRISIQNARKLPDGVSSDQIVAVKQHHEKRFSGFDLDRGSAGLFAGHFALEIVTWLGFNPIYLVAYDGEGGRFYDPPDAPGSPSHEVKTWNGHFREARADLDEHGVRVVNVAYESTLDAFDTEHPLGLVMWATHARTRRKMLGLSKELGR